MSNKYTINSQNIILKKYCEKFSKSEEELKIEGNLLKLGNVDIDLISVNKLLSVPSNERFKNGSTKIFVLNLAPDTNLKEVENNNFKISNTCVKAGYCRDVCVGVSVSGHQQYIKQLIRLGCIFNDLSNLFQEIEDKIKYYKSEKRFQNIVFRLNNFSDLLWEEIEIDDYQRKEIEYKYQNVFLKKLSNKSKQNHYSKKNIFSYFPEILFYDYTKIPERFKNYLKGDFPRNYFLTYSYDKKNTKDYQNLIKSINGNMVKILKKNLQKFSIAFIVDKKVKISLLKHKCKIENKYEYIELIDGDLDDCRIFDLKNQDRLAKIVLLEYNAKTGIKKDSEDEKYYLDYNEIKEKIEEINEQFNKAFNDSLPKH
ncbi:putative normocyte-binding protein 1 [Nautilia profundicola AmH]|uniref:Normocyte-binding protein 1 n=1 Tax=Nautilia profundicola (strain ATCC BAA-1463 / DSM 18972 / AmH) TaxID=598659 RepID=B9L707_NAUPA|nr:hypothetical protein [Nautilia profundicola]ACM93143.1 putative normocyte-binding protein 1 [Nautilia profundicola AmH]